MTSIFEKKPNIFRGPLIFLSILLITIAAVNFVNFITSPTDENVFITSPSRLYIIKPIQGKLVDIKKYSSKLDSIRSITVGDFLLEINGHAIKSMSDQVKNLENIPENGEIIIVVFRPSQNTTVSMKVFKKNIPEDYLAQLQFTPVVVTSVLPGGASDRAGMQVGDLICKINGKSFKSAEEADLILREEAPGKQIKYDILRNNNYMTMNVTLAKLGLPWQLLSFLFASTVFFTTGLFIGIRRPQLIAARLLALEFICAAAYIIIITTRRDVQLQAFNSFRDILLTILLCSCLAFSIHSGYHFPIPRPEILNRRWIVIALYMLALAVIVLGVFFGSVGRNISIGCLLFYALVISFLFRKKVQPEYRKLNRIRKYTLIVVVSLLIILITFSLFFPFVWLPIAVGVILTAIPVVHLYTIGYYRLLGMDLRIRRSVRYIIATAIWSALNISYVLTLYYAIAKMEMPVFQLTFTGTSIEVNDAPELRENRIITQRVMQILFAVGVTMGFSKLRKLGQKFIDRRYYRSHYDYRRAVAEFNEVMNTKYTMSDLAKGIVEKIAQLMQVERVGVLFFRGNSTCCCHEIYGFVGNEWEQLCLKNDRDLIAAIKPFQEIFRIEDLPAGLQPLFNQYGFHFIVPIRSKEELVGALIVGSKLSESIFKQEDLEFLHTASTQAAVAIENSFLYEELAEKARMGHELQIARNIQLASLPQETPSIAGLDIAGVSLPALEVGGDFYDYLVGDSNGVGDVIVIVGDVSGKGTSAALHVSKVQGVMRSLHEFGILPVELFIRTNKLLCRDLEKNSFVTAIAGAFNTHEHSVRVARAGHLPLYHYHSATDTITKIIPKGIGLGIDPTEIFTQELEELIVKYENNDIFVFITDGIIDSENNLKEEYGENKFEQLVHQSIHLPAEKILDRLLTAVHEFAGSAAQRDDQTVVVVKIV